MALSNLSAAVTKQDLPSLRRALAAWTGPIPARVVVEAGRLAWKPGLAALASHGADLNASFRNYRALHALIQKKPHAGGSSTPKRVTCLEWMIAHGADPNLLAAWPSARAVIVAAFTGEPNYVKVLGKPSRRRDVFEASAVGNDARVRVLLAQSPILSVDRDGGLLTALQCAAGSRLGKKSERVAAGLLEAAKALVDAGADVNAKTKSWGHDVDVAYFVVGSGQLEMLRWLLGRGMTPTDVISPAAWNGREDMIDLALQYGASLDAKTSEGRPLLNELIRWGQFSLARPLLARGASPNVGDSRGWTALHQAASRGNVAMVLSLLEAGADQRVRDAKGQTPRDVARANRRPAVEALFTA